jgi:hypothetical protein
MVFDSSSTAVPTDYPASLGQATRPDITGDPLQENLGITVPDDRERDSRADLPEDGRQRRIRFVSDVLRERSRQAVANSAQRRAAESASQDLPDEEDSSRKIA